MKKSTMLVLAVLFTASYGFSQIEGLPPNPEAGKCYVRCVTPDVYETEEKRIITRPAYKQYEVIPAEYKNVEETIMIKPASKRYVYHPAEYRTVTEEIQIEDPYNEISITPASFAGASERIEIRPQLVKYEYQANFDNCDSVDPRDCMVICAVEYPAEYRNVVTQVLDQAAAINKTQRGGKTITIEKEELVKEAYCEEINIDAEYTTITKRVLVKDEEVREMDVPADYAVETIETLTTKGGVAKWEEIDCELKDYNVLPIFYELGSARLTSDSRSVIDDKLLSLMREKPLIRIEISSHTDSRGSSTSNQALSQRRAESVVSYLINRGIKKSRLVATGYGETRLKNRCADGVDCSEAEHQQNRRTEFRVIGG